jgi:hypothetical protein
MLGRSWEVNSALICTFLAHLNYQRSWVLKHFKCECRFLSWKAKPAVRIGWCSCGHSYSSLKWNFGRRPPEEDTIILGISWLGFWRFQNMYLHIKGAETCSSSRVLPALWSGEDWSERKGESLHSCWRDSKYLVGILSWGELLRMHTPGKSFCPLWYDSD